MNKSCRVWTKDGYQDLSKDEWYVFAIDINLLHRSNGPAIEWADGGKEWWVDGKRHRLDGLAVEYSDGTEQWWVNGKRHRLDGPAVEWADGDKEWYVNGSKLYTEEVESWLEENEVDLTTKEGQMAFKLKFG